mmetsp:Transcript_120912/g.210340  ORF Transcript_120912/g.210340 Transcript_120912/m.210340 type:complete len:279 (+) Transcript_120912:329-1165(+)
MSCAASRTKPMLGMGTYTWICAHGGLPRGKTGGFWRTIGEKGVRGLRRREGGGEKTLRFLPPGCSIPTHSLSYTLPPRSVESQTAQCWRWWGQPVTGQERATGDTGASRGCCAWACVSVPVRCREVHLHPHPWSGRGTGCPLQGLGWSWVRSPPGQGHTGHTAGDDSRKQAADPDPRLVSAACVRECVCESDCRPNRWQKGFLPHMQQIPLCNCPPDAQEADHLKGPHMAAGGQKYTSAPIDPAQTGQRMMLAQRRCDVSHVKTWIVCGGEARDSGLQ